MKQTVSLRLTGQFFYHKISLHFPASQCKGILQEYHRILSRAKDIGKGNPLITAYGMGAWFIAMNRIGGLSPDQNSDIMATILTDSPLLALVLGSGDHYLSPKRIKKQIQWAEQTHKRRYENDWVADCFVLPGKYELCYDYLECGICKLCRDEGCPHLAKYLCRLDFLFAETMGLHLDRTTTLAEGGERCDFRFCRKENHSNL